MTSPHTLGLSEALRVSGIKSGVVPGIEGSIQPVMVLADFSATYTAEPFEARAITADRVTLTPNGVRRFYFELLSAAPGGLVVEYLQALQQLGTGGSNLFHLDVLATPPAGTTKVDAKTVGVGGRPTSSLAYMGYTDALPTGIGPLALDTFSQAQLVGTRVFVPPGQRLVLTGVFAFAGGTPEFFVTVVWREIPQPLGEP